MAIKKTDTRSYGKDSPRYADGGDIIPAGLEATHGFPEDALDLQQGEPSSADKEIEKQPAKDIGEDKAIIDAEGLGTKTYHRGNPDFRKRNLPKQNT